MIYVGDPVSVVHEPAGPGVHRLLPMPTASLGVAVGRLTRLVERPRAAEAAIVVPVETFRRVQEGQAAAGASDGEASLRALVDSVVSSSGVRVRGEGRTREVVWYDAGDRGLWRLSAGRDELALEPIAAGDLADALADLWR
jgi:hypothetical protein